MFDVWQSGILMRILNWQTLSETLWLEHVLHLRFPFVPEGPLVWDVGRKFRTKRCFLQLPLGSFSDANKRCACDVASGTQYPPKASSMQPWTVAILKMRGTPLPKWSLGFANTSHDVLKGGKSDGRNKIRQNWNWTWLIRHKSMTSTSTSSMTPCMLFFLLGFSCVGVGKWGVQHSVMAPDPPQAKVVLAT